MQPSPAAARGASGGPERHTDVTPPLLREREAGWDRQDRRVETGSRIIMANLALSALSYTAAFSASPANFPQQTLRPREKFPNQDC